MLVCTPLLWTVIMTTASSSEISSVSYVQSGNGHLCLGIVPGFVGVLAWDFFFFLTMLLFLTLLLRGPIWRLLCQMSVEQFPELWEAE